MLTTRARVEGAPVRLAGAIMAVPVAGWWSDEGGWRLEALALVLATPAGTTLLAMGELADLPPPDEGPGAALTEAQRDRLVGAVFRPGPNPGGWRLLRLTGRGAAPDQVTTSTELGRFLYDDEGPRLEPSPAS